MANELLNRKKRDDSKVISNLYSKDDCLDREKLEVLYFKPGKRKVDVIPLSVYRDGFSVESIDTTINTQNEISQNLYGLLHEGDDD